MLTEYSWDMTGYAPKYKPLLGEERITLVEAERIFQLQPEPPEMENMNAYVLLAILKKELKYFSFFLHHYEHFLNQRIRSVLLSDINEAISGERFLDIKLSCQTMLLEKLADYDPEKGAELTTYIYPFVKDEIQKFLMGEESWSAQHLSSVSAHKRYNTLHFACKVVCQQGCYAPLLDDPAKGGVVTTSPLFHTLKARYRVALMGNCVGDDRRMISRVV